MTIFSFSKTKDIFESTLDIMSTYSRPLLLLTAFLIYTTSAIFNTGFYHFDEHYQLVEFAELKAGNNEPDDLAWEYRARIRSTVQPTILFAFFSSMRQLGIKDPHFLMMLTRVLSGAIAVIIITFFLEKTEHLVNDKFKISYRLLSYFLWFLPCINVKYSSESYSGLIFILGIALHYSNAKYKYFSIGCLLALSFLFRFQTAFMSIGLILWLILAAKIKTREMLEMSVGGVLVLLAGALNDFWFYEQITITYLNYFKSNVLDGVASNFGVSPWYYYFTESAKLTSIPFAILIWGALAVQMFVKKCEFLPWVVLPFLLVHIVTPHKEMRFLFPLANLVPLIVILSIQRLASYNSLNLGSRPVQLAFVFLMAINLYALVIVIFSPADEEGKINITQYIHKHYHNQNVVFWITSTNPYRPIPVRQGFYRDPNVYTKAFDSAAIGTFRKEAKQLLAIKFKDVPSFKKKLKKFNTNIIYSAIPGWIISAKALIGIESNPLVLFEISN